MDPAACRVIYIDDRFNTERWISREGLTSPPPPQRLPSQSEFGDLPPDLQANVNAFLSVFNQGRAFSLKLAEIHEQVKSDCTPILACFDVGSQSKHEQNRNAGRARFNPNSESPLPSPNMLRRELTFSSENDESYGLQLLSRIASDLQVEEGAKLIIPVAVVKPERKDSYDETVQENEHSDVARAPYGSETAPAKLADNSDIINPQLMLQCLDAGALDVVKSPLDKAGIMGLTVHAYRIYKSAKAEQTNFMAKARRGRKQSWIGAEEEKPYAYLREAMVRKLLKGICDPQEFIEDYQHRDLFVQERRKSVVADEVGKWSFSGQDFTEDELVYAGYYMLNHALQVPELSKWKMGQKELLRFMQGCRIAYNSFVLYHNFKHAVDVLQSTFYFLIQIGTLPPYHSGSPPPPHSGNKSPIAKLLGPFEALTLLIAAIGHDVGHPGVNNMFLVKLNAPLAQLYNDTSVLEAFHCAAYSQILRRHWPSAFHDKAVRKLMISSILATDMGCHSDYMQQLGNLQEKIHESKNTDGWSPKDIDAFRVLTCGLLIKCADISNVARPWAVAEKWTHKLQEEFAHQGEMEQNIGMETTLFGGPPEIGNMLKLANGQIGFMTIFAHPLFYNVSDIIPAMSFAAEEILTNKGVWFTRAEHEKRIQTMTKRGGVGDGGVSPRTQSPVGLGRKKQGDTSHPSSPIAAPLEIPKHIRRRSFDSDRTPPDANLPDSQRSSLAAVAAIASPDSKPPTSVPPTSVPADAGTGFSTVPLLTPGQGQGPGLNEVKSLSPGAEADNRASPSQQAADRSPQVVSASPAVPTIVGLQDRELSDQQRDNAVSMRAGSASVPAPDISASAADTAGPESTKAALAKFNFATSDVNQPVRTYDPQQHYPQQHPSARASAPMSTLEHQKAQIASANGEKSVSSEPSNPNVMASTSLRGGGHEGLLTPSQSNEGTSYTTEKSEEGVHPPKVRQNQSARDRAISVPNQGFSILSPSYSLNSDKSGSRDGSKNDIRATIFSNGDDGSQEGRMRDRKFSTKSMGRKRSKLKMNLAFWKKRSGERNIMTEEEGEGTASDAAQRP